ncbi:NAD(P)H-dependent oxidoreductase [Adlercreutzia muris]|uniref:NAD(P)H-dependent oxidoreductase n=1 Tax=Adlercreutzia muris TaxID=1796610 RepID=UPI0035180655
MTILFVNACLRGEQSRTLTLCREYLEGVGDVEEVNLAELRLEPYYGESAAYRAQLEKDGQFDDPMFDLGRQFAAADEIVIGAPYWDLSFPAALKVYIEHVAVMGMVFHYTAEGRCEGLCRAKHLTYITTGGGNVAAANFGYEYLRGIAGMFGIPETRFAAAENLDVVGADIEANLDAARARLAELKATR